MQACDGRALFALDVVDVAATAVEFYAPAAELKGIALSLKGRWPDHRFRVTRCYLPKRSVT